MDKLRVLVVKDAAVPCTMSRTLSECRGGALNQEFLLETVCGAVPRLVFFCAILFCLPRAILAQIVLPAEWTVMVYINGKNNLEENAVKDLNELETQGSSAKVNVVAQLGRVGGYYAGDGDWRGVRRYLVRKDDDPERVTSPVLADLGGADMGDYRVAAEFLHWAKAAYPAKKYLFVIWNHGSGWTKVVGGDRGISYDDETGNHISLPQLGELMRAAGPVDVYASDACLMQMAEVAWELKDSAAYIVGSEETEPADGYPYDRILAYLNAAPEMEPGGLANVLVRAYGDFYSALEVGVTLSVIKTSALLAFRARVEEFVAAVMSAGDKGVLKRGLYYAQHYAYEDNKDMDGVLRYVAAKSFSERVRSAAAAVSDCIAGEVVPHKTSSNSSYVPNGQAQVDYSLAGGVAVYLPDSKPVASYFSLRWAKDSRWGDLLLWLYGK